MVATRIQKGWPQTSAAGGFEWWENAWKPQPRENIPGESQSVRYRGVHWVFGSAAGARGDSCQAAEPQLMVFIELMGLAEEKY